MKKRQNAPRLVPREAWQTRYRGSDHQEYEIYRAAAEDLGWKVKTFEEWRAS